MNPYFSQQPDNILAASLPAVYPNISEPITDSPLSSLFQKMFPLTRYHSSGPPASPKSGIKCVCNVWSQPVLAQRSDQRSTGKLAPTWKFPTRGEPFPSNTEDTLRCRQFRTEDTVLCHCKSLPILAISKSEGSSDHHYMYVTQF